MQTPIDWYSLVRSLQFNDQIEYLEADIDARYIEEFKNQKRANGPYHGKVVDFIGNPPYTQHTRIGVRFDGFHGKTPLYYVRLENITKINDKLIELILNEYEQRNIELQDRNAAIAIYSAMCKAHEQEEIIPTLSTRGQERVLSEIIGPMRSYAELRLQEEKQARDERIEKRLKNHGISCQLSYKQDGTGQIIHMVKWDEYYGVGETLEDALFHFIERLMD